MRYLIDTQIAIWAKENNPRLRTPIRDILEDLDNDIFISQFSFQELVIKHQIVKLPGFIIRVSDFAQQLFNDGFCYSRLVTISFFRIKSSLSTMPTATLSIGFWRQRHCQKT